MPLSLPMRIWAPPFSPNVGSGKFSMPCSRMQRAWASAASLNSCCWSSESSGGSISLRYRSHALVAASNSSGVVSSSGPTLKACLPPLELGSGMSTPFSRMHCANSSPASRDSRSR
jgi:hypothetical protein